MYRIKFWVKWIPILFALTISCSDPDDSLGLADNEYLIFGHYFGECVGEGCVEIFKLEREALSEDTRDKYPDSGNFYSGNYIRLDQAVLDFVEDLTGYFPEKLWNEKEKVIGLPDYADGGGLYIEYFKDGKRKFWLLDQVKRNVPAYLHTFIDEVNKKIKYINNVGRCELVPDPGPCEAAFPKYYYDSETGKCEEFLWGGCDGVVPFHTMEDCRTCLSD